MPATHMPDEMTRLRLEHGRSEVIATGRDVDGATEGAAGMARRGFAQSRANPLPEESRRIAAG
jgi:hypothetical protein